MSEALVDNVKARRKHREILKYGLLSTHSGVYFDPFNPTVDMIVLDDIAHALSLDNRFGGAARFAYSTAQHSVTVAKLVRLRTRDRMAAAWGLLHDAAEAYMRDMVTPLKNSAMFRVPRNSSAAEMAQQMGTGYIGFTDPYHVVVPYRAVENNILHVVGKRFQLPSFVTSEGARFVRLVHDADEDMLNAEAMMLLHTARDWARTVSPDVFVNAPWPQSLAKRMFLELADELGVA